MGNHASVSSEGGESTLRRLHSSDSQLLQHYLSSPAALSDAAVLSAVYREVVSGVGTQGSTTATALQSWLPPLAHERRYVKQLRLAKKADDTRALLALLPEHEAQRIRLLKCMQRESHFLVARVDPHAHTMHARAALLQRYQTALERWARREELAEVLGNFDENGAPLPSGSRVEPPAHEDAADKMRFLELLFARSLDDEPVDAAKEPASTFQSNDEFVGQLFSLISDSLPSAPSLEEELATLEQEKASAASRAKSPVSSAASYSSSSTKVAALPVRVFGVTGLTGLPLSAPSALAARAAELAADGEEPKPADGESDGDYAQRLHSYMESRKSEKKKRADQLAALQQRKKEAFEAKRKARESEEKQAKLLRQDSAAMAAAAAAATLGEEEAPVDPDASLAPEARFTAMQMLVLVLDESKALTLSMLAHAAKQFAQFQSKQQDPSAAASDETASVWPLSPLPATHLLYFLVRDLMRKALLCTAKGQSTLIQLHYVLKRVMDASAEILVASKPLLTAAKEQAEAWAAFEKQLQYEHADAGSLLTLFASCTGPTSSVPNAPPQQSPAGAASSSGAAASSSSGSSGSAQSSSLATAASPHAPLLSTLLSTSLLSHVALPSLSFVWATLFKPVLFESVNEAQHAPRNALTEEEEKEEEEERKESDVAKAADPNTFNLFSALLSFLHTLDDFNAALPSTAGEEALYQRVSDGTMLHPASNHLGVVVETPHTYFADTEDQQVVHIPNASYLVVEFDPRCSTERGRDHLTITVPQQEQDSEAVRLGLAAPAQAVKVGGPFHGPRDQWPRMPIVVENTSTLVFNFHSDQANNGTTYFGYRAIVTGYTHLHQLVPPPADATANAAAASAHDEVEFTCKTVSSTIVQPLSSRAGCAPKQSLSHSRPYYFLSDLQQSLAHVVGRVLRKEIVGTTPSGGASASAPAVGKGKEGEQQQALAEDERVLGKYLNSPLFYNEDAEEGVEEPDSATDSSGAGAGAGAEVVPAGSPSIEDDGQQALADENSFEQRFLRELIEAKAGSAGAQLDTLLRKKLQTKRVDQLGGGVTKKVVRQFVAVLIKHLGLTRMAAYWLLHQGVAVEGVQLPVPNEQTKEPVPTTIASVFAGAAVTVSKAPTSNSADVAVPQTEQDWAALGEQLVEVWRKGQALHQVVVSGKQMAQQALDNLIAEEESQKKAAEGVATSGPSVTIAAPPAASSVAASSSASSSSAAAAAVAAAQVPTAPTAAQVRLAQLARAKAESLATYEGFTAGMASKCEYLLARPSFSQHPLTSFADMAVSGGADTATPSLDILAEGLETVQGVRESSQDASAPHTLRSLLSIYHTTQHVSQVKESTESLRKLTHKHFASLTELISTFVRDDIPLRTIRRIRQRQVERAKRRADGINTLLSLLQSLRLRSSHVALMATTAAPFRQYAMYPLGSEDEPAGCVGGHFLSNVEASGKKYRQRVHDAFGALFSFFIKQLQAKTEGGADAPASSPSVALQSLILDAMCIDWHASVRENSWIAKHRLMQVVESLVQPRMSSSAASVAAELMGGSVDTERTPFQRLAANLLTFLSINCMHPHLRTGAMAGGKGKKGAAAAEAAAAAKVEEEKAMVPVERKTADDGDEKQSSSSPLPSPSPTPSATDASASAVAAPFAFLTTPASFNNAPLDALQQSVLDRLVTTLQHSVSLLPGLRKQGGETIQDIELVDISLTPEQRHLLHRRKNRPSASSAVSSSSAQERQAMAAGILSGGGEDDNSLLGDDGDDIDYSDAHPSFPLIRRYIELEQSAFETLALLAGVSSDQHHRAFLAYLCTPPVLRTLLLVFVSGSPRMQTIAIRMLCRILPLVSAFQLREHSLYDYLVRADKDERFGAAKVPSSSHNGALISTPSTVSASSTPFSQALRQSYEPQSIDSFSLGDSMPQPQSLALSRSSSLRARNETDALLSSMLDSNEEKMDQLEAAKFVTFLFRRLADLQLATTEQQEGGVTVPRPNTPLSSSGFGLPTSSSNSSLSAVKQQQKSLNPLQYHDGAMKLTLAAELVTLIRTLHKQTTVPAALGSNGEATTNSDWSTAICSFLSTHLLSLGKLVSADQPLVTGAKSDVGMALACCSVIGGHSEVLRVGGMVVAAQKGGEREQGILVSVERLSNRARVLFCHTPARVIECTLSRVRPVDTVAPSPSLVTLSPSLLRVFQTFTLALAQEEQERLRAEAEAVIQRRAAEEEAAVRLLQKQFDEEQRRMDDPFGGLQDELAAFWACPACTFENPMVKPQCELCGQENPSYFIKQTVVEEEVDPDDEAAKHSAQSRVALTNEHLLYYQLRSKALKALCVLLSNPHSMRLLFESGSGSGGGGAGTSMLPALVAMAVRPTHLDVFASIESLEESETRLVELLSESAAGLVQDHLRFNRQRNQGADLKFSPFKHMQLHLPSRIDAASARAVTFVGDRESLCEVRYNGGPSGSLSVGLIRANFLVPNSLPAYYFEVTIHALGSPALPGASSTPRSGSNSPQLTPQLIRKHSPVLRALASPSRGSLPPTPTNIGGGAAGSSSSASSSSAFDIAVGLFRCGMPEGHPGQHSTYAVSARHGELHLTRSRAIVRSRLFTPFKAGDVVGCGVHVRYGQRTVFFTRNGKLLHASDPSPDELGDLDLASGGTPRGHGHQSAITSISGVEANLSGRFYPAVWFENSGAHVSINFGQQPFQYDFASETLPADFRQKLKQMEAAAASSGGKKLSAAELRRRTMAEDLMEMMGNFPLELIMLALERCNDDKAAAGDWLFSSGQKELENMAQHALRSQADKKRAGPNGDAEDGESSGEDEDLADYLLGGDASQAANGGAGGRARDSESQSMLDDEVDVDIPMGLDLAPRQQQQQQLRAGAGGAGGRGNGELERQRERARALLQLRGRGDVGEEELQNILASVLGRDGAALGLGGGAAGAGASEEELPSEPIIYENIKLDDIANGARLVVSPACVRLTAGQHSWMAYFAGRTGVVTGVSVNSQLVTLIFSDSASGIKRCASFPVHVLQQPQRMWLDPARDFFERQQGKSASSGGDDAERESEKNVPWQDLAHELVSIEKASSVQKVRRAVLRIIANWPRGIAFDAAHLNGPQGVLAILKLTAAQFLSSSYKKAAADLEADVEGARQTLLDAFRSKLVQLVASENERLLSGCSADTKCSAIAPPLRITEKLYAITSGSSGSEAKSDAVATRPKSHSFSASASASSAVHHGGYSSASANESEDDGASSRRGASGLGRSRVSEEGDEDAEDDGGDESIDEAGEDEEEDGEDEHDHDDDHEADEGHDVEDEYDDEEYDEDGEDYGGPDMADLGELLRNPNQLLHQAQHGAIRIPGMMNAFSMGGRGGGAGLGGPVFMGRPAIAAPVMRPRKKKAKKSESEISARESLDEKLQEQLRQPRSSSADSLVTPLLVEECLTHIITAVNHGPTIKTCRSAHPYPSNTEKRGRVHIGGAAKLLVRFDPRTAIGNDMMTRLSFYRDAHYTDLICTVQGSGPPPDMCFPPIVIDGDRLFYRFTSGANSRLWGYKFRVEPIDQRIDDKSALLGRNFELSGWLLDLFLRDFAPLFQYSYAVEIYNALAWYVCNSRPSMKSRGVDMLVRLLFHLRTLIQREQAAAAGKAGAPPAVEQPKAGSALGRLAELKAGSSSSSASASASASSASSSAVAVSASSSSSSLGFVPTLSSLPDFTKLASLSGSMDSVLDGLGLGGSAPQRDGRRAFQRSLQSPTVMGLVELLSTVDLLDAEFQQYAAAKKSTAKGDESSTKLLKAKESAALAPASAAGGDANDVDLVEHWRDRLRVDRALLVFRAPAGPGDSASAKHASSSSSASSGAGAGAASSSGGGDASAARPPKDITADMQKYLSWANNLQLFIPTDPAVLKDMPGFENEVSASSVAAAAASASSSSGAAKKAPFHKLHLTYSILSPVWDGATQQLSQRVAKTVHKSVSLLATHRPTLIKPVASRFEGVVNMSRLTLEMKQGASAGTNGAPALPRLPGEFVLEAHKNYTAQRQFLQIVGERVHDSLPTKPRLTRASPSAGAHSGTRSYTLAFWIYLNSAAIPPAKEAHFRYIVHAGNMPEQSNVNLAHGRVWPHSGFSVGLGAKDNNIHTVFYESSGTQPLYAHSRSPLLAKRWTHVTLILTDGIDLTLYIDGSCEIQQKLAIPLPALTTDPLFVGALPAGMMKLFRNQSRQADPAVPEDPYRQGLGFSGALKDARLYSYDVDPGTFVPMFQERARKLTQERANRGGFHVAVDKPTLVTRREISELMGGSAGLASKQASASASAPSSSSASLSWTPAMDIQLMELFTAIVAAVRNRRPQQEQPEDEDEDQPRPRETYTHLLDLPLSSKSVGQVLAADPKLLQSASLLAHLPLETLKQRFSVIQLLNARLVEVMPFVDWKQSLNPWSLAHRLASISWLILLEVKNRAWKGILASTAQGHAANITINRPRALKARERGNDPDGLRSVFGQCFQQLHFLRPASLRVQQGARPFRVKFAGEGGIDAGGLFRDAVSEVCSSVQSRDTPLFVPCPNASGFGDNADTFLPNPRCTTSLHLSQYAFLGKFMAMAIRGGHVLNLDFPALLWKLLVAAPISRGDIADVNALCFKILSEYADSSLDEAQFASLPLQRFVTLSTDGREVELIEGGAQRAVTFANRLEYVRLEEHYRLHEFDLPVAQMRRGMGTIVPVHLLALFTASELEAMVCGSREVNIEFLRRNTEYQRGMRPTDAHVRHFWSVLEEFTQKERQAFVRFVSGQSRLWSDDKDFTMKFKLMPSAVDNDIILPVSHTCFFSLELPRYSSQQVMREKISYAMNNCTMIDADTAADNLDWDSQE